MIVRRLLRRLLHTILLLIVVSAVWFALLAASPGDYFDLQRLDPRVSPETIQKLRVDYGLNKTWPIRYLDWLRSVTHGDMRVSIVYNQPVTQLLLPRVANTLLLTVAGTLLAWAFAIPAGLWAGVKQNTSIDRLFTLVAAVLIAIPELLLGILLVYWVATNTHWPVGGMHSTRTNSFTDVLQHLLLPAIVLAAGLFPVLFQHLRTSVAEASSAPFVRSAKSLGIPPHRIWLRYVLPVAANPMISLLGLSIGGLWSSSLLIEVIFGWPGLGPLFVEAVMAKDTYLVLTPVICSAVVLAIGNLLADLFLLWNDPRIRTTAA
jgi:peptide/nickel transport system permease protein